MNTISSDFKFFIEHDANPFFIFNSNGKLLYLNQSAEYVVNEMNLKELFELALTYAPKNFGNKVTNINLSYGFINFYAINILYQNDDEIALHLYNKPSKIADKSIFEGFTKTDINVLLKANLELFKMNFNGKIKFFVDLDIPKFHLNQNLTSILLRNSLELFKNSNQLNIELKLKIGEMILINNKKYPIVSLKMQSDQRDNCCDVDIKDLAVRNYINTSLKKSSISFEIPFIR